MTKTIRINRAPVLTLWAAVVAERLGHKHDEALTLGKAVAGLNAQSKGRRLGIFHAVKKGAGESTRARRPIGKALSIDLLGRHVPALKTPDGIRATVKGIPVMPVSVERYLEGKFGEALPSVRAALEILAKAFGRTTLETEAFSLYEKFRPTIPEGKRGWGAAGELDLRVIGSLIRKGL